MQLVISMQIWEVIKPRTQPVHMLQAHGLCMTSITQAEV